MRDWQGAPHTLGTCRVWREVPCSIVSELARALQEMCSNLTFLFAPMNSVETICCSPLQRASVRCNRQHSSNPNRDTVKFYLEQQGPQGQHRWRSKRRRQPTTYSNLRIGFVKQLRRTNSHFIPLWEKNIRMPHVLGDVGPHQTALLLAQRIPSWLHSDSTIACIPHVSN